MPRPTIEQIRNLGDFATTYQWNLSFVTKPKVLGVFPSSNDLNLRCVSTAVPTKPNGKQEIGIRGHKVYQPGQAEYGAEIQLTFQETVDNKICNMLLAWHEACVATLTGSHLTKKLCEAKIRIDRLNRQDLPIWSYNLVGCFLSSYEHGELGADNETMKPTLTITYDYFRESAAGGALGNLIGAVSNIVGGLGL